MFNHHIEKIGTTHWEYSNEKECFIVNALKTIKKGESV